MKRRPVIALIFLQVLAAVILAAPYTKGLGKNITATTTSTVLNVGNVASVSVYNGGGSTIYCLVNSTAAELDAAMVAAEAEPVPVGASYTFETFGRANIESVVYCTSSGSADGYIAAF